MKVIRYIILAVCTLSSGVALAQAPAPAAAPATPAAKPAHHRKAAAPAAEPAAAPAPTPAPEPAPVEATASPEENMAAETATTTEAAPAETAPAPSDSPAGGSATNAAIGKWGVGYWSGAAPIGIRRWMNDKMGYDLGVGLTVGKKPNVDMDWSTNLEAAILYSLARFDNMVVFARGGILLGLDDPGAGGVNLLVQPSGHVGGEFFLTALGFPNLSFTGGVGVAIPINKPDGGKTSFALKTGSEAVNIVATGNVGFHIYF